MEHGACMMMMMIMMMMMMMMCYLLVLVELLEVVDGHLIDTDLLSLLAVLGVTQDADLVLGLGDDGKLEGAAEALVALSVVVLEGDLHLDRLDEVSLLALLNLALHRHVVSRRKLIHALNGLL
jgi:hypothetical protein